MDRTGNQENDVEEERIMFEVIGLLTSIEFQKSRLYTQRLHKSCSNLFDKPIVRPMLNVDWIEYLTKIRRTIGGKTWYSVKSVAIFLNNKYIGDDDDLNDFIRKDYFFAINTNIEALIKKELRNHIISLTETGRRLAYLTIHIDDKYIGALLFLLYTDLVPITCNNFLKHCTSSRTKCTYQNRPIHRVVEGGWIQGGGWTMKNIQMPCENYTVPHNRRGVLSMSNSEKHINNSTQFIVSLVATPWMDYKYVAFGQLIQGEEVLQAIERVPTVYEYPSKKITIINCGEYTLDRTHTVPDKDVEEIETFLSSAPAKSKLSFEKLPPDVIHPGDVASNVMLKERYELGLYSHELDFQSHGHSELQLPYQLLLEIAQQHEHDAVEYEDKVSDDLKPDEDWKDYIAELYSDNVMWFDG